MDSTVQLRQKKKKKLHKNLKAPMIQKAIYDSWKRFDIFDVFCDLSNCCLWEQTHGWVMLCVIVCKRKRGQGTEKVCWCVLEKDKKDCIRPQIIFGTHHFMVIKFITFVPLSFWGSLTLISSETGDLMLLHHGPVAVGSDTVQTNIFVCVWVGY